MPVKMGKVGGKYKVVEAATGKVAAHSGSFSSKKQAVAQAAAINISMRKRKAKAGPVKGGTHGY